MKNTFVNCVYKDIKTGRTRYLGGYLHAGLPDETSMKIALDEYPSLLTNYDDDYILVSVRIFVRSKGVDKHGN